MTGVDSTEVIETSTQYSLTPEDFQKSPEVLLSYKQGDRIIRDNFASFITTSFAVSRGRPAAQETYFRWLRENQGFDYVSTIRSFASSGGWYRLSEDERRTIIRSIRSVKKHDEVEGLTNGTDQAIGLQVALQLGDLLKTVFDRPDVLSTELKGMTFRQLQSRIGQEIEAPATPVSEYTISGQS